MAITQTNRVLVHDLAGIAATERRRTTSRGTKQRVTLDIRSEAIGVMINPVELGRPVAEAIAAAVREEIKAIAARASDATVYRRTLAQAALARGSRWATKRYAGGRTGTKPPNADGAGRLYNDSGRLAEGVHVGGTTDGGPDGTATYTINVPANRFDASEFTAGAFQRMLQRLIDLVPILKNPAQLGQVPEVREAISESTAMLIEKQSAAAARRLAQALQQTAQQAAALAQELGNVNED